jgi:serine O-acetyltransferase
MRGARHGLRRYLNACPGPELGFFARVAKCVADIRADQEAIQQSDAKYKTHGGAEHRGSLIGDLVQKIGLQMMAAYRVMRTLRDVRLGILAKLQSRMIRHLYAADIHWDADIAPGVVIVHGTGLVISHAARVGPGCILFQGVTLGMNLHPERPESGAPTLEADVHVGPGATLLGPITIGRGSKVTASALVMRDVPAMSIVETPAPTVRPRRVRPRRESQD